VNANPSREADLDFQMVDVEVALHQMEASGTKLNVVMLDACRNNPFGGRGLRAGSGGLTQMQAPEGTLISYATQPNNVAQDGTDGNSPYSKALAETIRKPGLDIFQSFNRVVVVVKKATGGSQQTLDLDLTDRRRILLRRQIGKKRDPQSLCGSLLHGPELKDVSQRPSWKPSGPPDRP